MSTFVIIDGNALIHRSYHALPKTLRTASGELTNAVHGFVSILLGILEKERPLYLATAWDMKGPTFRDEMLSTYKGTRAKTDDELIQQFPRVYQVLEAFSVPMFKKTGLEADDYLGIVSAEIEAKHPEIQTLIVTSDKDALQLVTEQTRVVAPLKGYSEVRRYDRAMVKEIMGVWPEQVPDYKGLCGDNSDNIVGVPGIGPKTAISLLENYGNLEGVYENLAAIPSKVGEKLAAFRDQAFLCREVATILKKDDFNFDLEACKVHDFKMEALREIFNELAFRSHWVRVEKLNEEWKKRRAEELQGSLF